MPERSKHSQLLTSYRQPQRILRRLLTQQIGHLFIIKTFIVTTKHVFNNQLKSAIKLIKTFTKTVMSVFNLQLKSAIKIRHHQNVYIATKQVFYNQLKSPIKLRHHKNINHSCQASLNRLDICSSSRRLL